ncbi:D-alanyl-D-alanine carboxypeptidase [bacterium]|nr:D-alanyl-D-alanine carboxypeptidase [candidate division CSSED10-310 bacterium]
MKLPIQNPDTCRIGSLGAILLLLTVLLGACIADAFGGDLRKLAAGGAVMVAELDGTKLFAEHPDALMVPASILKIATASAALRVLGADYRFTTEFLTNDAGDLMIRGGGDPLLVSEAWSFIIPQLKEKGLAKVRNILLDDSAFDAGLTIPGVGASTNPYDAFVGALSVNFNTIHVVKRGGIIQSAEPQTPLTPLAREKAARLKLGKVAQRIRIDGGRLDVLRYTGELCRAFLEQNGIQVTGVIEPGSGAKGFRSIHVHPCLKSLDQVISDMMRYSNNFMANQVFLVMGAAVHGGPATIGKGQQVMAGFLQSRAACAGCTMVEGSGISRDNRMTARCMLSVLLGFHSYKELLSRTDGVYSKTGTLSDTKTLTGFFPGPDGRDRAFVILLDGKNYNREGILRLLQRRFGKR